MCPGTTQNTIVFLLASILHTYRQSQYGVQAEPVLPFNSCVTLRIEIILPPTQVIIKVPFTVHLTGLLPLYCEYCSQPPTIKHGIPRDKEAQKH